MQKNSNRDITDAFQRALEDPSAQLPPALADRLTRLKAVFARWLGNPLISDTSMRDYIITQYHVGRAQAYSDIALVKVLFGNAPAADRELQRMRANRLLEQAAAAALAGDDRQAKALTKIAEAITKANKLDADNGSEMPWDDIVPQKEEFSTNPETIGIPRVPNVREKARKLLERYTREIDSDIDEQ